MVLTTLVRRSAACVSLAVAQALHTRCDRGVRFGVVADVQYCDIEDARNFAGTEIIFYRGSLEGARRAARGASQMRDLLRASAGPERVEPAVAVAPPLDLRVLPRQPAAVPHPEDRLRAPLATQAAGPAGNAELPPIRAVKHAQPEDGTVEVDRAGRLPRPPLEYSACRTLLRPACRIPRPVPSLDLSNCSWDRGRMRRDSIGPASKSLAHDACHDRELK